MRLDAQQRYSVKSAIREIDREYREQHGTPLVRIYHLAVGAVSLTGDPQENLEQSGSHIGSVGVELVTTDQREWSDEELKKWLEDLAPEDLGKYEM